MRGPGEVLGVMQHGLPMFKVGHLMRDGRLIQQARDAALELLREDSALAKAEHARLRQAIHTQYGTRWALTG